MSIPSRPRPAGRHRAAPGDERPRPAVGTVTREGGVRTDVQALRALAVGLVVVYHLSPGRLSGGFVGVDVFFVISGFLITAHLLRKPPRGPRDLLTFWSRRIRRLLPASLLVLLATLVATRVVAPDGLWRDTATQVRSAALYVINWTLAGQQVDYLHPASPPTPVQHFWSLSVEEQFYLGWPILLAVLCALAVRFRALVLAGIVLVVAGSFAWSIRLTDSDPTTAYFATTTRIWELGIGGALAAWVARGSRPRLPERAGRVVRVVACWAGLAVVAGVALTYTDATPFPSWRAALPVGGAALVIAAAAPRGRFSPAAPMALRPVQYLGDISYSVYLWHWPLIILAPSVSDGRRGRLDNIAILLATLVLAALTKRFVEDRFRTPAWGRTLPRPYALAAVAMAVVVAGAQLQLHEVTARERQDAVATQKALKGKDPCYGAAAVLSGPGKCTVVTTSGRLVPTAADARREQSDIWHEQADGLNCFSHPPDFPLRRCEFGPATGTTKVALVGNSHGAQWLPAIREVGRSRDWSIVTYTSIRCSLADVTQNFADAPSRRNCDRWVDDVVSSVVADKVDLVVMSNRELYRAYGTTRAGSHKAYLAGYRAVLQKLSAGGVPVVVIRDTPTLKDPGTTCMIEHPDDYTVCGTALRFPPDDMPAAVRSLGRSDVHLADMTRFICPARRCSAAIGGVPVFYDDSHLAGAYSRTLAPMLQPDLLAALKT
ncbi:acyltransferase family protein [Jatrophihabitans fulvus]